MHTIIPAAVLRRVYDVAPERLFDMWTTPETLQRFLGPRDGRISAIEMDVREGGGYRIGMRLPDGEVWTVKGTYRIVRRPEKLQMTWVWEEDDVRDEHETLLTIDFLQHGNGTELVLTHERFATEESRAGHTRGWTEILETLGEMVKAP